MISCDGETLSADRPLTAGLPHGSRRRSVSLTRAMTGRRPRGSNPGENSINGCCTITTSCWDHVSLMHKSDGHLRAPICRWDDLGSNDKAGPGPEATSVGQTKQQQLQHHKTAAAASSSATTAGPEAAKDFTKPRMPTASFGHASVKEAMKKELQERRRVRELVQREQGAKQQEQRRLTAAASAAMPEVPTAAPEDPTAISEAQRPAGFSSPERLPPGQRLGLQVVAALPLEDGLAAVDAAVGRSRSSDAGRRELAAGRSVSPSWALLERSVRSHTFGPTLMSSSRSISAAPRFVRPGPGPGSYAGLEAAYLALSYVPRVPSAIVPLAARDASVAVDGTGGVGGGGGWMPSLASLAAWHTADPAAARDRIHRRAPTAIIGTEGLHEEAATPLDGPGEDDVDWLPVDIRYSLVEARVKGPLVMRPPPLPSASVMEEGGEVEGEPADPWSVDDLVRAHKPSWSFGLAGRWPEEGAAALGGLLDRPPQPLEPNYSLVRPRLTVGIPRFSAFLNLRCDDVQNLMLSLLRRDFEFESLTV